MNIIMGLLQGRGLRLDGEAREKVHKERSEPLSKSCRPITLGSHQLRRFESFAQPDACNAATETLLDHRRRRRQLKTGHLGGIEMAEEFELGLVQTTTFSCAHDPALFSQGNRPCKLCGRNANPNGDSRQDQIFPHNLRIGSAT